MERHLEGKVTLVTGGAAGIGRASALRIAKEGSKVVVSDLDEKGGTETVKMIGDQGGLATFVPADVSDCEQVEGLIKTAVDEYGQINCAFNNAGIEGKMASTPECPEDNWDKTIAVNLKGTYLCMKYEIRHMLENGGGSIVNMSSVAGLVGFSELPAYSASKHGVLGLTKTAALEFAEKGVRINAVCPGVIQTKMIDRITGGKEENKEEFRGYEPMGRMGKPEEIASAVMWLLSDGSSFVTGESLAVDGGFAAQ